ncbi:hypothetical protein BE21_05190 [Sorangium cellulosum]|uniref:DUF4142 domain-containing protein n=1 Tax=Sorangium cellulosum TaxID=56 RepID=A0A150TCP5_SORCE|nr:hypothetical protein BE21_05190 [Sorangium cellulosum]
MMRHHFRHRVAVIAALAASVVGGSAHAAGRGGYAQQQGAQISQQQRPQQQRPQHATPKRAHTQVSDGAIAGVVSASNQLEISMATIARKQARSREVKDFACEMIEAHTQAERRLSALLRRHRIQVQPTRVSAMLVGHAPLFAAYLRRQPAQKFDQAFMNAQVMTHRYQLRMLDEQLIPKAKEPALRQELQRVREQVVHHLEHAQAIQANLAKQQQGR